MHYTTNDFNQLSLFHNSLVEVGRYASRNPFAAAKAQKTYGERYALKAQQAWRVLRALGWNAKDAKICVLLSPAGKYDAWQLMLGHEALRLFFSDSRKA